MHVDVKTYIKKIQLPPGFRIDLFAENVKSARSMALGQNGTVFVGTRYDEKGATGKVYAIVDQNKDGKADKVLTIAQGLNVPNGVAFHQGNLYVAEISRILRFPKIEENLNNPPESIVVNDQYPKNRWHGWKFIRFGPDNKLYVPVGAPCNTCEKKQAVYASITRINPDGSQFEIFARGIRNTVGFDWHPETKELWFTENGRDEMGDDIPPEEVNYAPKAGLHFGFPYVYGKALQDKTYKSPMPINEFQPAAIELQAHTAALGMRFYTGTSFPKEYKNQIFVAQHGSWNRSKPVGYKVSLIKLDGNKAIASDDFATGWLIGDKYWGRPVDVLVMPDGALLVSDDFANCIYRITYAGS
ncbi:MAG TPA: sorbosone dehydrogenase family protein [Acidobacteriota bacterium]|nr:sorbosone dehydrogenase family protein [Acidobacteriota bacterium]